MSTRHKTDHGQAAVVDLGEEALLLVGRGHVAEAEAERVVEVEQDLLEGTALACVEIKILRRVHAIDATPARWRGDAGSSSPRNDFHTAQYVFDPDGSLEIKWAPSCQLCHSGPGPLEPGALPFC